MKQKLIELREEIDSSTALVGNINTPLTIMDRTTRQNTRKETEDLNNTVNRPHLRDRALHPGTHILLKRTQDIFQHRYMQVHK